MMKQYFLLFIAILLLSFSSIAQEVKFLGKQKPEKPLFNKRGDIMHVAVILPDAMFKAEPSRRGADLPDPPGFLDVLIAYEKTNDKRFFLVKKKHSEEWGWMSCDEILDSPVCLRSEDTKNPAFLKALTKNNWRVNKELGQDIFFYEGPGEQFKKRGKISIFQIRYAYKNNIIGKDKEKHKYVFIGNKPTWEHDSPSESLKGWIRKDFCILWDNQVAVYYDKETLKHKKRNPVYLFHTKKDLMNHLNNGSMRNILGKEAKIYPEISADSTRFSVIEYSRDMMQIAWMDDAMNTKSKEVVDKEYIDKKRGDVLRGINKMKKMDVLFLVDSTKSMKNYFKYVADGISYYINGLEPEEKSRVRFAFAIYRDHDDYPNDFQLLHDFNDKNIINKIENATKNTYSQNRQYYEAVFNGINKGVNAVFPDYDENISKIKGLTRAVVVIGDHGNRNNQNVSPSTEDLGNLLKTRAITFYAINVGIRKKTMYYNNLFQKQMNSIVDHLGQNGETKIIKQTVEDEFIETRNQIIIYLRQTLDLSNELASSARQLIVEGKSISEIRKEKGIRVTNYTLDIMRKAGWTNDDFQLADFSQLCLNVWVSRKDKKGIEQLKPFCLIKRSRLDALVGLMGIISDGTQAKSRRIEKVIRGACEQAAGDPILEGETVAEYIQRVFHIPYRELSKSLRHKPKDIENKFLIDKKYQNDFIKNIKKAYKLLHFVQERKIAEIEWNEKKKKWLNKKKPVEKEWFFFTSSDVEYCWLPFEFLP